MRILPFLALLFLLGACQPATESRGTGAPVEFHLQTAAGPLDGPAADAQVRLLFFGYTNCPDLSPTALATGAQALNGLTPAERERVRLVLVTVDPERDTPTTLQGYTAFFHPLLVGASATPEQTIALAKALGTGFEKQAPRPDGSYFVDHSGSSYLLDGSGRLAVTLPAGASPQEMVAAIRSLL